MTVITKFIAAEKNYFYSLPQKAQSLIISYLLQGAAYPLLSIFINAYIWRSGENITSVALYNLGMFTTLPVIFYLNGFLLRKFKITALYFFGCSIITFGAICVIFFSKFNPLYYFLYGCFYGIGMGFYWANRNFLTLQETQSSNRNYFIGLNFSLDTLTSILVPFIAGWFIVLGNYLGLYTITQSYVVLIIFAFILLLSAGLIVLKNQYVTPEKSGLFLKKITKRWLAVRGLTFSVGLVEGIVFFLPTILILTNLGHEGILGTVNSVIAFCSGLLAYYYGRRAHIRYQQPVFLTSVFIGLLTASIFTFLFNNLGTIIYVSIGSLIVTFMWLTSDPLIMDIIDEEVNIHGASRYSLACDRELFLNIGRCLTILILFLMLYLLGQQSAIRYLPLIVYLLQIIILAFCWKDVERLDL